MTLRALLELLQAFVTPGSVLAFDDAQYLDSASWTLVRRRRRLLGVV